MKDNTCLCQCAAITVLVAKALRIEVDSIFKTSEKYLSEGVIAPSIKHQLEKESERVLHVFRENNLVGQAQLLASKYINRSPNMAVIYLYTDSGDLVHCNMCDTDMLVPTGADKCPKCYFEGGLQWLDDNNQESTVSQLSENRKYILVTRNDPETTEYLSDEVLKDEFNTEPNPEHKYTPKPVRKPTVHCTPDKESISKENFVSSFFFYMWNSWCREECIVVFGGSYLHFWSKWCGLASPSAKGATELFYAELTTDNRVKLVNRACELYDGRARRKPLPE